MTTGGQHVRDAFLWLDDRDGRKVMVTKGGEDRFVVTQKQAVEACHTVSELGQSLTQFHELAKVLGEWINKHTARIFEARLAVGRSGLLFVVTQVAEEFDEVLMQELTELDIQVANNESFNLITMNVLAIPRVSEEATTAFVQKSGDDVFVSYAEL